VRYLGESSCHGRDPPCPHDRTRPVSRPLPDDYTPIPADTIRLDHMYLSPGWGTDGNARMPRPVIAAVAAVAAVAAPDEATGASPLVPAGAGWPAAALAAAAGLPGGPEALVSQLASLAARLLASWTWPTKCR